MVSRSSCFRSGLVVFLLLACGGYAFGGDIVPWLSGAVSADLTNNFNDFNVGSTSADNFDTNLPATLYDNIFGDCQPTLTQDCTVTITGSLKSYGFTVLVYANQTLYSMSASFVSGNYSAYGDLSCWTADCQVWASYQRESDSGTFVGFWNNGWESVGNLSIPWRKWRVFCKADDVAGYAIPRST